MSDLIESFSLHPAGWWAIAAGIMLCAELVVPGVFLVWIGIAAGLVALVLLGISLTFPDQLLLFAALSVVTVYVGWRWYRRGGPAPQGKLRDPSRLMIGTTGTVAEPIRHGRGKVRINDSLWLAEGPDLDAGVAIRVVDQQGTVVKVEAAP